MKTQEYTSHVRLGRWALVLAGLGMLGMATIHPRSMAGQARPLTVETGDLRLGEALAVLTDDDCDTNGEPEPCDIDCNANTRPDDLDVYMATSRDCDGDRMPDECQPVSPGDLDGDGVVGLSDRAMFAGCHRPLIAGIAPGCDAADQNGDGRVDCADWAVIRCGWTDGDAPAYARCRQPADVTMMDD